MPVYPHLFAIYNWKMLFVKQTVGNTNYLYIFVGNEICMSSDQPVIEAFYINVGERVRLQRKKVGMDQETLSRHLNLSRTTIINIEKGRQRLSLEHAWLAAQVLGISIEDLLPPAGTKSVADWAKELQKTEVSDQAKKGVMKWISKAKTNK